MQIFLPTSSACGQTVRRDGSAAPADSMLTAHAFQVKLFLAELQHARDVVRELWVLDAHLPGHAALRGNGQGMSKSKTSNTRASCTMKVICRLRPGFGSEAMAAALLEQGLRTKQGGYNENDRQQHRLQPGSRAVVTE
jgi:hypothetical protein